MALGATAIQIVRLVLGGGIRLIAAGTLVGLAVSLLVTRLLDGYLLNVSTLDPAAFVGAASVLLARDGSRYVCAGAPGCASLTWRSPRARRIVIAAVSPHTAERGLEYQSSSICPPIGNCVTQLT